MAPLPSQLHPFLASMHPQEGVNACLRAFDASIPTITSAVGMLRVLACHYLGLLPFVSLPADIMGVTADEVRPLTHSQSLPFYASTQSYSPSCVQDHDLNIIQGLLFYPNIPGGLHRGPRAASLRPAARLGLPPSRRRYASQAAFQYRKPRSKTRRIRRSPRA
jgi:hypothetical protein